MTINTITILALLILLVLLAVLWVALSRIFKRNTIVKIKESDIVWESLPCPKCRNPMQCGYSLAGKGVIWREKSTGKPGTFANIGSVLENTMSINLSPALNISWRCANCQLVMLDNSKMISVKKDA